MSGVRLKKGDVVLVYTDKYGGKQSIGLIKYIGNIQGDIMKQYVGIELIEPTSSGHNGCINGIQYFQCKESYGIHILITNVIKILESKEIMIQLQEIIEKFKNKLSQYIGALNQRDSYISDLINTQKKIKSFQNTSNPNTHYTTTAAPLTPIVDNNNNNVIYNNNNLSYEQMLHSVDNAITSQSLAIKLDAKRINNEYQMKYQTPLTHKSNTTKSSNNYSPITATNTLDSGTPSSMTPAPKTCNTKSPNKMDTPTTVTTTMSTDGGKTMLIHSDNEDEENSNSNSEEPDPLMTPTMDPIAETHSFQVPSNIAADNSNQPHWIRDNTHNTNLTHSPSQPRLFNKESGASSPGTPYNNMIYYPDYDTANDNDIHSTTESYFSATSSTYNTPKSGGNITGAHAHGLLATWNARKLSKQSTRSNKSNSHTHTHGPQPRLRSREDSKAKSRSREKDVKYAVKNVPHIYTGTNTPTLSANNDAILSGKAYDNLPPITVPNKQARSSTPIKPQRSTSLIFTPSQIEKKKKGKYSFKTIVEEPSPNNNSNHSESDVVNDTPRFSTHHSTPIFHCNNSIFNISNEQEEIDNMTPELPLDNKQQQQQHAIIYQRQSLPPQQPNTNNILKRRTYGNGNQNLHGRSSLPPQQELKVNNNKHMSASSHINIAVPTFTFNKNINTNKQIHFQSLQNIHEHKNNNNNSIAYHQSAPQLDHWVDHQQIIQQQQQQEQMQQQQMQQQQIKRPFSAHEYITEYDYNIPSALPLMNNKAKSMPAPNIPQSFHIPSQQSIDMNPYIDAQFEFIGFQPQTEVPNIDMIEGVPIGPPIRRSPQSSRSPLNGPMPPQHNTNNTMAYSVHSGSSNMSSIQSYNNNMQSKPKPIITSNTNVVLGKVQFAPRKSISKQIRRMSKNSINYNDKKQQLLNQRVPQSKTNVIKHSQQLKKSQSHQQIYQLNPTQMAGFTLTDAMYD